jgi:hypothetical protein
MRPFSGVIEPQRMYEACIPFKLRYPYKIVKDDDSVVIENELFPEGEKDSFIDEAKEIEIATTYKLRPIIIIAYSETSKTYLAVAVTKRKDNNPKLLLAICNNKIAVRHFLPLSKYSEALKYDSYVLVDAVYMVTDKNIYYHRGRLDSKDFDTIRAKLKSILSLSP